MRRKIPDFNRNIRKIRRLNTLGQSMRPKKGCQECVIAEASAELP